jgi:hypothetical protein
VLAVVGVFDGNTLDAAVLCDARATMVGVNVVRGVSIPVCGTSGQGFRVMGNCVQFVLSTQMFKVKDVF